MTDIKDVTVASSSVDMYTVQEGAGQNNQKLFLKRKLKTWIKACSWFFIYLSLSGPVQSRMQELWGQGASNQEVI